MVNDRQSLDLTTFARPADGGAVEWQVSHAPVPYLEAVAAMEVRVAAIAAGEAPELVWLLENTPLYTSGTGGNARDLLDARFPLFATGRGGQLTYHGPGQRVAYVMLDLKRRRPDVRAYVASLERWLIDALKAFEIVGETREAKIAAIGVRVRRWATLHGVSLNVDPDLTHFSGIVPCGVAEAHYGVTSLANLGRPATMA